MTNFVLEAGPLPKLMAHTLALHSTAVGGGAVRAAAVQQAAGGDARGGCQPGAAVRAGGVLARPLLAVGGRHGGPHRTAPHARQPRRGARQDAATGVLHALGFRSLTCVKPRSQFWQRAGRVQESATHERVAVAGSNKCASCMF